MSQRYGWRRLLLCAALEFAALTGAPVRPSDIEDALRLGSRVSAQQKSQEDADATDPILPAPCSEEPLLKTADDG